VTDEKCAHGPKAPISPNILRSSRVRTRPWAARRSASYEAVHQPHDRRMMSPGRPDVRSPVAAVTLAYAGPRRDSGDWSTTSPPRTSTATPITRSPASVPETNAVMTSWAWLRRALVPRSAGRGQLVVAHDDQSLDLLKSGTAAGQHRPKVGIVGELGEPPTMCPRIQPRPLVERDHPGPDRPPQSGRQYREERFELGDQVACQVLRRSSGGHAISANRTRIRRSAGPSRLSRAVSSWRTTFSLLPACLRPM
jgi:hypothetical protein